MPQPMQLFYSTEKTLIPGQGKMEKIEWTIADDAMTVKGVVVKFLLGKVLVIVNCTLNGGHLLL